MVKFIIYQKMDTKIISLKYYCLKHELNGAIFYQRLNTTAIFKSRVRIMSTVFHYQGFNIVFLLIWTVGLSSYLIVFDKYGIIS